MPPPRPEPEPEPKEDKKKRKSKEPTPVAPAPLASPESYSYSYSSPPPTAATPMAVADAQDGNGKNTSGGRLRLLLVLLLLVAGGIGGMMYWNEHPSSAGDRVNWDALTALDFSNVWNPADGASEAGTKKDPMADIPADAVEARAFSVADDGLITIRYKGKNTVVRLAGIPADFADQCLGAKGVARLERILPKGGVIYVLLDGEGRLGVASDGPQQVYVWGIDADANKVRYANQELVVSGEAAFAPVTRSDHPAAQELERASVRATDKQKGRVADGACP
jgi:hypothetical protein